MRRFAIALVLGGLTAAPVLAQEKPGAAGAPTEEVKQVHAEMQQALGVIPDVVHEIPPEALPGVWQQWKSSMLIGQGELPTKEKALIGLAVSATQAGGEHVGYFHEQAARAHGATDREIREAVALAGVTRNWSTFLEGASVDLSKFRKDVDRIFDGAKRQAGEPKEADALPAGVPKQQGAGEKQEQRPISTAEEAYADIQATLGFVPDFFRAYPKASIAGAWREMKAFQLGETALDMRVKELIGLGVAATFPCDYCIYFHTQAAKAHGAGEQAIAETAAMAGGTLRWAAYFRGFDIPLDATKGQIDRMIPALEKKKGAERQPAQPQKPGR